MAAASRSEYGPNGETHYLGVAAAAMDIDLPSPGFGQRHVIDTILLYITGTLTAFDCQIQDSTAAIIGRAGGQVPPNVPLVIHGPIRCKGADATQIAVTTTGGTRIDVTVNAHREPA